MTTRIVCDVCDKAIGGEEVYFAVRTKANSKDFRRNDYHVNCIDSAEYIPETLGESVEISLWRA